MPTAPTAQSIKQKLQSIKQKLEKGTHVILRGPPGTGKTHLAMQTIRQFLSGDSAKLPLNKEVADITVYRIAISSDKLGNTPLSPKLANIGKYDCFFPHDVEKSYAWMRRPHPTPVEKRKSIEFTVKTVDDDGTVKKIADNKTFTMTPVSGTGRGQSLQIKGVPRNVFSLWDIIKIESKITLVDSKLNWTYTVTRIAANANPDSDYQKILEKLGNHSGNSTGKPTATTGNFTLPETNRTPVPPPPEATQWLTYTNASKQNGLPYLIEISNERTLKVPGDVLWDIVQFHPTYSYSDFVRGVDPDFKDGQIRFKDQKRTFLNMCESAIKNPETPHVLIVDEINRAALGSVFGELILGLEDEYKGIPILTGSGDRITIPKNLALLGTMNSSDRSIGVIDHALKRRFEWIELPAVLESSDDVDEQLLKDLNDLLASEVREERGFGKWMIGSSGKCANVAFTIIPQLETLLREGELNSGGMSQAAEKVAQWFESQDEKKFGNQIMEFVRQHNPASELISDIHETVGHDPESTVFEITLPETRANPNHPKAYARYDSENKKWTVLKDSGICKESDKFGEKNTSDLKLIEDLKEKKIIQLFDDDTGVFLKDWPANSISQSARIPKREQTTDGGKNWKTEDGTRFRDWVKSQEEVNE